MSSPRRLGRVTSLYLTAIKGFGVDEQTALELMSSGIRGNRRLAMLDARGRLLSVTRTSAFLPYWSRYDEAMSTLEIGRDHDVLISEILNLGDSETVELSAGRVQHGRCVSGELAGWLSAIAGQAVHLVLLDGNCNGHDVHPVTLISEASANALGNEGDGSPLSLRRFRMSICLDLGPTPFREDALQHHTVTIGTAVLRIGGPVPRCAAVQHHPDGAGSPNVLRAIRQVRGVQQTEPGRGLPLGVYATVLVPGMVTVGDALSDSGGLGDADGVHDGSI